MPVYEYRCNACGREFEYQQRMSDPEKTTCESCGQEKLERLISRTAFQLKGGGWYKDLYSSSKPDASSASSGSSSTSTPAASTSSDSSSGGSSSGTTSTGSTSTGSSGSSSSGGGSSATAST